jgi:hypothetical protein
MSVCTNLGLDRSSRLAAYAGYVVLRARLRAHKCALAFADPPYLHRIVPMSVCANFQPDRPSRLAAYSEQHSTTQDRTAAILDKYAQNCPRRPLRGPTKRGLDEQVVFLSN